MASTDIQNAIERWDKDGRDSCFKALQPLVLNSGEGLFDVMYTLVLSITSLSPPSARLSPMVLGAFIQSMTEGIPSTSASTPLYDSPPVANMADVLVDTIWTVDVELEDTIADSAAKEVGKNALAELIGVLLASKIVRPSTCRERLEPFLLAQVALVDQAWNRKLPRVRTALNYKQRKFNLLRETNEGYSKLIVELTSLIGPPHSASTARPVESQASLSKRAKSVWEKIVGFIGYFDLDPSRVLDVVLDVFSSSIVSHYAFFLELIGCSGWSRAEPIRGSANGEDVAMMDDQPSVTRPQYQGLAFQDVIKAAETAKGSSDASSKPPIISEILGFKFANYQNPDSKESASKSLYIMAALLIREGFITLADIYHHLIPLDTDFAAQAGPSLAAARQRLKLPQKTNALVSVDRLKEDDGQGSDHNRPSQSRRDPIRPVAEPVKMESKKAISGAATQTSTPTPKQPPNQKLKLLSALLAIGALRPAFSILAKFPWVPHAHPEVSELLLRVMNVSIRPLLDLGRSSRSRHAASNSQPRPRYSSRPNQSAPETGSILVDIAPPPVDTFHRHHVFFYPDWTTWIPRCTTLQDVPFVLQPMMQLCGVQISRDVEFIGRLCKVGRMVLAHDHQEADASSRQVWKDLIRMFILPSLTLVPLNIPVSMEVWNVLSLLELPFRWACYDEWRKYTADGVPSRKYPELIVQAQETTRETKGLLRRLDANAGVFASPISRMTHSNPLAVLSTAMGQVDSYAILAEHIPDALESMGPLGFDVLTYLILRSMADSTRETIKPDGVTSRDWLRHLATFTSNMVREYRQMELGIILQHVLHQLHRNSSRELLLLQLIISAMTSIDPIDVVQERQIMAFAGGPLLWIETISRTTRGSRSGSLRRRGLEGQKRLMHILMTGQKLALPLLIALAQYRGLCSFRVGDGEWHPKHLTTLFDSSHAVLFQYVEFLSTVLSSEEYAALVPSFADLTLKYGLEPSISFHILRPAYEKPVFAWNREIEMKEKVWASRAKQQAQAGPTESTSSALFPVPSRSSDEMLAPCLSPLILDIQNVLPARTIEILSPQFYATFWQMALVDVAHPSDMYEATMKDFDVIIEKGKPQNRGNQSGGDSKEKDDDRKAAAIASESKGPLLSEMRLSLETYAAGRLRLTREKRLWFKSFLNSPSFSTGVLMTEMVQHCIHPRLILSPWDAEYCARLIHMLHKIAAPGFCLSVCHDKLIGDQLAATIASCSDKEIVNYSHFLRIVLAQLDEWHLSGTAYRKGNRKGEKGEGPILPGFIKKSGWLAKYPNLTEDEILSHADFKLFVAKLHKKILKAVFACLGSNDFVSVKNALMVLSDILPIFPLKRVVPSIGMLLESAVKTFQSDERSDIKVLAIGYWNKLNLRRTVWAVEAPKTRIEVDIKQNLPKAEAGPVPSAAALTSATTATNQTTNGATAASSATNGLPPRPQMTSRASSGRPAATTNGNSNLPTNPTVTRANPPTSASNQASNGTVRPIEEIPRPEFIKRIARPEARAPSPHATPTSSQLSSAAPETIDRNATNQSSKTSVVTEDSESLKTTSLPIPLPEKPKVSSGSTAPTRPSDRAEPSTSAVSRRADEQVTQGMPPPSAPSSKPTAQDLRSSAKTTAPIRDEIEDRAPRSSRRRSPSPSRPSTRERSVDSRASGADGHTKSDRSGGRERDDKPSRRTEEDGDRERVPSNGESRRSERVKPRDEDRDRRSDRDRGDREREKSGRDRHRRDKDKDSLTGRKDRERDLPSSSSRAARRDEDRSTRSGNEPTRSRVDNDDGPNKRRREDEENGPSKRMRDNGQNGFPPLSPTGHRDESRRDPRDGPKEDLREPARRPSPNGRDRYRPDHERDPPRRPRAEGNGRDESRSNVREDARGQAARDRDDRDRDPKDREKGRGGRDGDRRVETRTDDRGRRDNAREGLRDELREKDRAETSRQERKDRDIADSRASDQKDILVEAKAVPRTGEGPVASSSSGAVPSGPRAMSVLNKPDNGYKGMRSDSMNGSQSSRAPRAAGGGSLLNRIGPSGSASTPSAPRGTSKAGSEVLTQVRNGAEQEPASAVPRKRTPVESPADSTSRNKRVKINRNFGDTR